MISPEELNLEKQHLLKTRNEINRQMDEYSQKAARMKKISVEQREYIWNNKEHLDDKEYKFEEDSARESVFSFADAINEHDRLTRLYQSPYFGRIDFKEDGEIASEPVYIGTSSLVDSDSYDIYIYDWRSPIASMFYDFECTKALYQCEEGTIQGEITLKRQYRIDGDRVFDVFDSTVTVLDDILQDILSQNAGEKMKSIVTTIQKEQNAVIRDEQADILIIQGAAGSGKTSVALHRIAYLLYRRKEKLNEKNMIIFSPNDYFNSYISQVLPELGEKNIRQTTFPRLLYDFYDHELWLMDLGEFIERVSSGSFSKAELDIFEDLTSVSFSDFIKKSVESLYEKGPVFEDFIYNGMGIMAASEMREIFLSSLPVFTAEQRIDKIKAKFTEYLGKIKDSETERIKQALIEKNGLSFYVDAKDLQAEVRLNWLQTYDSLVTQFANSVKLDEISIYSRILTEYFHNGEVAARFCSDYLENKTVSYCHLSPLTYVKLLLGKIQPQKEILHVVIDEAQDYNQIQYRILDALYPYAHFTILGDCNQLLSRRFFNSRKGFRYIEQVFDKKVCKSAELNKRYRSTVEINEFADGIVKISDRAQYIDRHGPKPKVMKIPRSKLQAAFVRQFEESGEQGCVIITKSREQASGIHQLLKDGIAGLTLIEPGRVPTPGKYNIIPSYLAKGLEFDEVIVYTDGFAEEDKNLLYICCTRALHKLTLISPSAGEE